MFHTFLTSALLYSGPVSPFSQLTLRKESPIPIEWNAREVQSDMRVAAMRDIPLLKEEKKGGG
jgi:hypothetical protein